MTTSPEALREQPFERYHALASWIDRLANNGAGLSLGDWVIFLGALNHALTTAERGGEKHLADVARLQSALQEAREAEGHYVCGFQQANMEARMIVAEVLGDTAENAAIQAELVATADRRALSPGGADE